MEEAKKELFSKGLVIENVVQDTELEDLWAKEVLGAVGAKKAAKKMSRKGSKKKANKDGDGEEVKSSLQKMEEKMKANMITN